MMVIKKETRGRKPLVMNEKTKTAGICLPENIYNEFVKLGEQSKKGYGFHIRQVLNEYIEKKNNEKDT